MMKWIRGITIDFAITKYVLANCLLIELTQLSLVISFLSISILFASYVLYENRFHDDLWFSESENQDVKNKTFKCPNLLIWYINRFVGLFKSISIDMKLRHVQYTCCFLSIQFASSHPLISTVSLSICSNQAHTSITLQWINTHKREVLFIFNCTLSVLQAELQVDYLIFGKIYMHVITFQEIFMFICRNGRGALNLELNELLMKSGQKCK